MKLYFIVVLICIFSMTNDTEQFFICLFICLYIFFGEMFIHILCQFFELKYLFIYY